MSYHQDPVLVPSPDRRAVLADFTGALSAVSRRISFRLLSHLQRRDPPARPRTLAARLRAIGWPRRLRRWVLHHRGARATAALLLGLAAVPSQAGESPPSVQSAPVNPAAVSSEISWLDLSPPGVSPPASPGAPPSEETTVDLPPRDGAAAPPLGKDEDAGGWLDRWFDGLQIYGQKTLNYRWVDVQGSEAARRAFENTSPNYRSLTHLTVLGRLLDVFEVNVMLTDGQYGTDPSRMAIKYRNGRTQVTAGDIATALTGNSLIPLNRILRAVMVERQLSRRMSLTGLVSETRAMTRRVEIPGNNTVGPYYLNAFPIVVESVRVRIDELDVARENFMVDAYAGTITFKPGYIVPQTSTIYVSFEARTEGAAAGTLWGFRATHSLGASGSLGATLLMVGSDDATDDLDGGERTDDWFEGHADSNGPYQLRYGPVIRGSERVYVAGVLQQPNRDYYIQYDRGVIQFTRLILSTEHIRVHYRPVREGELQETVRGEGIAGPYRLARTPIVAGSESVLRIDAVNRSVPQIRDLDYRIDYTTGVLHFLRAPLGGNESVLVLYRPRRRPGAAAASRVIGFDGSVALGRSARLAAQFAMSAADGGASGTGMILEARGGLFPSAFAGGPRLRLGATWKRIDPEFTGIESVNFLRNEQGVGFDGEFLLDRYSRLFSRWERSRRPLGFGAVGDDGSLYDTTQSFSAFTYTRPNRPHVSYSRIRLNTNGEGGGTDQGSDTLQLRYTRGHLTVGAEYLDSSSRGLRIAAAAGSPEGASVLTTARTGKLFASFSPGPAFSLSGAVADSRIRTGHEPTRARNVDLTAQYRPWRAIQFTAEYQVSDSGSPLASSRTGSTGSALGGPRGVTAAQVGTGSPTVPEFGRPSSFDSAFGRASGFGSSFGGAGSFGIGLDGYPPGLASSLGGYSYGIGLGYSGGNTTRRRIGIAYTPDPRLSLNLSADRSDSELYGQTNGHAIGFSIVPGRRLSFHGTLTRQRAGFVNPDRPAEQEGAMTSDLLFLSLRARPIGKLAVGLDFQDLETNNRSGLVVGLPESGVLNPAAFATNVRTLTGRVSHPIGAGRTAFVEFQDARYGGTQLSARKKSLAAGVEFAINRILGVTLGAELHDYRDEQRPDTTYRARLLNANVAARF